MYKKELRSKRSTHGRKMAGARSLWRVNGMRDEHFRKPIIAVVNSFSQFVPGHVHLDLVGNQVKLEIEKLGYFAPVFNTIAIDDGIAMGHEGMLYSLPSRDLIADSIEYVCQAHAVDAMICISNCDKITPGMLMAMMRLNIPGIIVSGGPMQAGELMDGKADLVDVMVAAGRKDVSDQDLDCLERMACPGCGSCAGLFTANSMNCLAEAIGLALPGNGTVLANHVERKKIIKASARQIVKNTREYYVEGDDRVLPRSIANKKAFENAMRVDVAMGGSSNTVLHLLAIAREAECDFTLNDIDRISRETPVLCKLSPSSKYHIQDFNRAGGIPSLMAELQVGGMLHTSVLRVDQKKLAEFIQENDLNTSDVKAESWLRALLAPISGQASYASNEEYFDQADTNRSDSCLRSLDNAYSQDGGLAVLYGNIAQNGCVVKTAGVPEQLLSFKGPARIFHSQEQACDAILNGEINPGDVVVILYEGPAGGPGMQEMLYPTSYLKSMKLDNSCALITDGRFSGGTSGLSIGHISPEAAAKGNIALVMEGDLIEIDIPKRRINVLLDDRGFEQRRQSEFMKGFPFQAKRVRKISKALEYYSKTVASADRGAVRQV